MNNNEKIRDILVARRKELGISLSEMSRRLNIPKSTLSRYENLKHQYPLDEIQNFSSILDLKPEYILGLDEKSSIETIYNQLSPPRQQKVYDFAESQLMEQKREDKLSNFDERTLQNLQRYAEEFGIDALDSLFEEMLSNTEKNDSTNHEAG